MTENKLQSLRRKDLLLSNLMAAPSVFVVYFMFTSPNPLILILILSVSLVVYGSIRLFTLERSFTLFEWQRALIYYEQEKLGVEWKRREKKKAITLIIVGLFFLFLSCLTSILRPMNIADPFEVRVIHVVQLFTIIIVSNIGIITRARSVDRRGTNQVAGITVSSRWMITFVVIFLFWCSVFFSVYWI